MNMKNKETINEKMTYLIKELNIKSEMSDDYAIIEQQIQALSNLVYLTTENDIILKSEKNIWNILIYNAVSLKNHIETSKPFNKDANCVNITSQMKGIRNNHIQYITACWILEIKPDLFKHNNISQEDINQYTPPYDQSEKMGEDNANLFYDDGIDNDYITDSNYKNL